MKKKFDFITIDFETANKYLYSACSVGIAAVKDGKIIDKYYTLIDPPITEFDNTNVRIHGITKKDVASAPAFEDIWDRVQFYIDSSDYVVAHNAHFDMSVLYQCLKWFSLSTEDFYFFDSMVFGGAFYEGKSRSLDEMCKFYNIELLNHHNAFDDAKAAAEIVLSALEFSELPTLDRFLIYNGVPVQMLSEIQPQEIFQSGFKQYKSKAAEANLDEANKEHHFYNKNIVITGEFVSYTRSDLMEMITKVGGTIKSGVSKNTHILLVGQQDKDIVGDDGLSSKQEKAIELINKGIEIQILNENEFLNYFK